jgi:3-phosphoshikimate 1-carboxyvinyltransferase
MTSPTELTIVGPRPLRGRLEVPGDKSISHRALMFAALASGRSTLRNLGGGDDVTRTRTALEQLGVRIRDARDGAVLVQGMGAEALREPDQPVDCGNSGTTIRILTGIVAARPFLTVLTGDASIVRRPMGRVAEPLRQMGAHVDGREGGQYPPLVVRGGALTGVDHDLGVASAQVKSALLLAGLAATGTTSVTLPAQARDHTERMLAALGVPVEIDGLTVRVRAGAPAPFDFVVPGDPSAAAFFVVGACITPGSDLVVADVCLNPTRVGFVEVLQRMGADIATSITGERLGEPVGEIRARHRDLVATRMAGAEIPNIQDEIPALAVAAAFAEGVTEIRDAAELVLKESNRIGTIAQELSQMGTGVETHPDGLTILGGRPRGASLKSHGDHRIAMAFAIAANACTDESRLRGWRAVESSYPRFADDLATVTDGLV